MERLLRDLRFTVRLLWKDRAFALTALLTLGGCIGTNAAIFAIVNSVLLRPLPVPEPERLVLIHNSYPRAGVERASNGVPDDYDRLREAYQVSQRRREIGIRMALGSDARRIFGLVIREGVTLLGIGVAIGLAGAFAIRRTMESQLYGVGAMDPMVVTSVAMVLGLVALVACAVPARRAARIDPVVVLSEQSPHAP